MQLTSSSVKFMPILKWIFEFAEDQFTAEWNQLHLHNHTDLGTFSFQTSLYKNGTIVFAYKGIPVAVKSLNDTNHPVKVGLSDAYITDKTILCKA